MNWSGMPGVLCPQCNSIILNDEMVTTYDDCTVVCFECRKFYDHHDCKEIPDEFAGNDKATIIRLMNLKAFL